jgi:tight adherence protein B
MSAANLMVYAVAIVSALGLFALAMGVFLSRMSDKARRSELRRRLGAPDVTQAGALLKAEDDGRRATLAKFIDESGLGWDPGSFINWSISAGAAGILFGAVLGGPFPAFVLGLAGGAFFPGWVEMARQRRMRKCDQQMPQALQLMVLALRAGHALPGALALAAREAPQPVSGELRRAVEANALGRPIGQVLEGLAKRLPQCDSAQTLAVAVAVLEQTGGNLISVLERIIDSARARTQYKARLRALTAQGRMSAWVLGCMPLAFAFIAVFLDPNYASTLATRQGLVVVFMVICLWACGITWTIRMVKKESRA